MAESQLKELTQKAAAAVHPGFPPPNNIRPGGVDPLGLRQINFDLMDQVLPGLNNVARHIRPFVVVSWAWRRAAAIAKGRRAKEIEVDKLADFVDRIEVIYAWSQFQINSDADLPGRQVLGSILQSKVYRFAGANWERQRKARRDSTAFTAAINYGPGLKNLGWVLPHEKYPRVLIPTEIISNALDAFEAKISNFLTHPAFSKFGPVSVTSEDIYAWAKVWALENPTSAERKIAKQILWGEFAPNARRSGIELILATAQDSGEVSEAKVRRKMCGPPSRFLPPKELMNVAKDWRRLQVRQVFRLTLESFFYWIMEQLTDGPRSTTTLVSRFLSQSIVRGQRASAGTWLNSLQDVSMGPVELLDRLDSSLASGDLGKLAQSIVAGLSFCLSEPTSDGKIFERPDRLPLTRAVSEFERVKDLPPAAFVKHVIESWVLAQHAYWSIGRGLADARQRGKAILRLRVSLEDGGWELTPGAVPPRPFPTPDRLQTVLNLAQECGALPKM